MANPAGRMSTTSRTSMTGATYTRPIQSRRTALAGAAGHCRTACVDSAIVEGLGGRFHRLRRVCLAEEHLLHCAVQRFTPACGRDGGRWQPAVLLRPLQHHRQEGVLRIDEEVRVVLRG